MIEFPKLYDESEFDLGSPWVTLDTIDWSCVTRGLSPKKYSKNEVVCHQNSFSDYVYLVKAGRVRLDIVSQSGEEKTLFIADKGAFIGELSPMDGLPNIGRATAVTDSLLFLIPKQNYINEMKTNCDFSSNLLL